MGRRLRVFGLLTCLASAACTGEGSYQLHLLFPDTQAREDAHKVSVQALVAGNATCVQLLNGDVAPGSLQIKAQLLIDPLLDEAPVLPGVGSGHTLFYVEGRSVAGFLILQGCQPAEVRSGTVVDVTVLLMWICRPLADGERSGNGQDDDCDGLTDECLSDDECNDDNGCTLDVCLRESCHFLGLDDGTPCNDLNPCTQQDRCRAAACQGEPKDCSAFAGPCLAGACDPETGGCGSVPLPDGTSCDDGMFCTEPDTCQAGICTGPPLLCKDSDVCTQDVCNEGEHLCDHFTEPRPGAEGPREDPSCSDGIDNDCDGLRDTQDPNCLPCNEDEECQDNNPCTNDVCDLGECRNLLLPDGAVCDDERFCTVDDACTAGVCSGAPRECSGLTDACHEGICLEAAGQCQIQVKPEGTACEDGLYCTVADLCIDGLCRGVGRECDDDDRCTLDECNEPFHRCEHTLQPVPEPEGMPGDATCSNDLDDDCDGLTDLEDGNCAECLLGSDCEDHNACTRDTCIAGECANELEPAGTACDDDLVCTHPDTCMDGLCQGPPRDCSLMDDDCNQGLCDETSGGCVAHPVDGVCDDGDACTTDDTCSAGRCQGRPRDTDADTFADQACGGSDCDDSDPAVNPEGMEGPSGYPSCSDGLDNDCDSLTDGADPLCGDPVSIFRSVGPGSLTPLAVGDGNALVLTGATATFSVPLPDLVGVGDVLLYDKDADGTAESLAFVHGRTSSTRYELADASGAAPLSTSGSDRSWSLYRAYTSLADAESGAENAGIPAEVRNFDTWDQGVDLVSRNQVWHIACYADSPDTTPVLFDQWSTAENNYLKVYTPVGPDQVGVSQRHAGKWSQTAYRLIVADATGTAAIFVMAVAHLHLDGLLIENTALKSDGFVHGIILGPSGDYYLSNSIIRATSDGVASYDDVGFQLPSWDTDFSRLFVWNNVITGFGYGIKGWFHGGRLNGCIYSNTIIACSYKGIALGERSVLNNLSLKNNLVQGGSTNYDHRNLQSIGHNLSQDDTSPDEAYRNQIVLFISPEDTDFHLAPGDSAAQDEGLDLSNDVVLPIQTDMDGQIRVGTWDIGADESN